MCEILDRVEQKGFQAGYKQGIEQGKEQWIGIGTERGIEIGTKRGIEIGTERGIEQERIHSLLSLMSTLHFSPGQAMDALQIPEAEREYYMVRISSK